MKSPAPSFTKGTVTVEPELLPELDELLLDEELLEDEEELELLLEDELEELDDELEEDELLPLCALAKESAAAEKLLNEPWESAPMYDHGM